ncbi:MAG TPA: choice-of-anchor E domain-containing protein [Terriglobia bacterium]
MQRTLKTLALSCSLVLLLAAPGLATSITDPFSFSPTTTPFNISSSAVPQFNPTLGTLTSITIDFSGSTAGKATIANGSSMSGVYTFSIQTTLQLFDPTASPLFSIAPTFAGTLTVPSGGTVTSGLLTSPTATGSLALLSGFGPYEGTGTYVFSLAGTGFGTATGPTPFMISEDTAATSSGEVIYTFSSSRGGTPELSSLLLLGSGLGFLGLLLRRRLFLTR